MILVAGTHTTMSAGTLVLVTCFSAWLLIGGVRHYRGRGQWLMRWLPTEVSFFTPAWYGAFGLMIVLCELARTVSLGLEVVLAIPTLLLFVVALMSLVWLPSRLLPEWYRARRRQRRLAAACRAPE